MSRLVKAVPAGGALKADGVDKSEKAQGYGERVAKYVPAEVIAAYLALLPVVIGGTTEGSTERTIFLGVILGVGLVFSALYVLFYPGAKKVKLWQAGMSVVAFLIWAYSIPEGFFDDIDIYKRVAAVIFLVVFTLASGLVAPTED